MIKNYITVDGHRYKLVGDDDVEDDDDKDVFAIVGDSWNAIHLKGTINGSQANVSVCDNDTLDIRGGGWDLTTSELGEFISFLEDVKEKLEEEAEDDE